MRNKRCIPPPPLAFIHQITTADTFSIRDTKPFFVFFFLFGVVRRNGCHQLLDTTSNNTAGSQCAAIVIFIILITFETNWSVNVTFSMLFRICLCFALWFDAATTRCGLFALMQGSIESTAIPHYSMSMIDRNNNNHNLINFVSMSSRSMTRWWFRDCMLNCKCDQKSVYSERHRMQSRWLILVVAMNHRSFISYAKRRRMWKRVHFWKNRSLCWAWITHRTFVPITHVDTHKTANSVRVRNKLLQTHHQNRVVLVMHACGAFDH